MRNLERNMQTVYYRKYLGLQPTVNDDGDETGELEPTYDELQSAKLCVSPDSGSVRIYQFGQHLPYSRTMTTADTACDIDETCVLWIDGADTEKPWNYRVTSKAVWKNSVQYTITRAVDSGATNEEVPSQI